MSDAPESTQPSLDIAGIVKAHTIGGPRRSSELLSNILEPVRKRDGFLSPPYNIEKLTFLYENSTLLPPNINAYITNIEALGHHFEPDVDFIAPDADDKIRDALFFENLSLQERSGNGDPNTVREPTDEEVQARKDLLKRRARVELARAKSFFAGCCPGGSFIKLRKETRLDLETTGNAYWEVLRNNEGVPARFVRAPSIAMRITARDEEYIPVKTDVMVADLLWEEKEQFRAFRRFVQFDNNDQPTVWFKEFGDPRVVSRETGEVFSTFKALQAAEARKDREGIVVEVRAATEIIHFKIPSPRDNAYGVPRWIGALREVLGSMELSEVNLGHFQNKTVPPMALLVSGGRFGKGVVAKLEEFFEDNVKGRSNFHRILVLEAEPAKAGIAGPSAVPRIQFVPLREAQQSDAIFQKYDDANQMKLGSMFRQPRILRGDDRQINRATSFASLRLTEDQVYEPERNEFDETINLNILPAIHIRLWLFRSNAPTTRDPEILSDIVVSLAKVGVLVPAEAREIAKDIFNKPLAQIDEAWTKRPLTLTLAELKAGSDAMDEDDAVPTMTDVDQLPPFEQPQKPATENTESSAGRPIPPLSPMGGPQEEVPS